MAVQKAQHPKAAPVPVGWSLPPITEAPFVAPTAPKEQEIVELPPPVSEPLEEPAAPVDDHRIYEHIVPPLLGRYAR